MMNALKLASTPAPEPLTVWRGRIGGICYLCHVSCAGVEQWEILREDRHGNAHYESVAAPSNAAQLRAALLRGEGHQ